MTVGEVVRRAVENYKRLHPLYSPRIAVATEVGISQSTLTNYILGLREPKEEMLQNIFTVCDYPQGIEEVRRITQHGRTS